MNDLDDTRELRDLLQRSVHHVHPPVARLVNDARADGRRLVRSRRRTTAVAVSAAIVVLGVAAPLGLRAAEQGSEGGISDRPTVTAPSPSSDTADDGRIVSRSTLLQGRLEGLLPAGAIIVGPTTFNVLPSIRQDDGYSTTRTRVQRPGVGAGQVRISQRTASTPPSCPTLRGATTTDCRLLRGPDGSAVGTATSTSYGALLIRKVVLTLPIGGQATIAVANTDDKVWGPSSTVVAPAPPLSLDELVDIASAGTSTPVGTGRQHH